MRLISLFLLIWTASVSVQAQMFEPVKWTITSEHLQGDEHLLIYEANMDNNWTVYSQYTADDGPIPTSVNYETEGFEKIGKAEETGHKKEGFDKMFEVDVIKFLHDEPYIIKQKVKAASGTEISGYLTYMTCDSERCLPPTDVDFTLVLTADSSNKIETKAKPDNKDQGNTETQSASKLGKIGTVTGIVDQAAEATTEQVNKVSNTISTQAEQVKETVVNKTSEVKNTIVNKVSEPLSIPAIGSIQEEAPGNNLIEPVSWDIALKALGGDEYALTYTGNIENGWTVYSQFTADDGPYPTEVTYESPDIEKVGKGTESGHKKEGFDKIFEVEVIKMLADEPYVITHKIKAGDVDKLKGYLTYMACDASKCLPPTDVEFAFDLKSGQAISYDSVDGAVAASSAINVPAVQSGNGPKIEGNNIDQKVPTLFSTFKKPIGNCIGGEKVASTLLMSFIFGFLGGLLALLTPCVFPMIPLTVSFFTKDTKRKGWVNGLIYGASIVFIYVALGLGITAIFGGDALNRLSTNWISNTLFFLIFVFFAFSFFGYYEITLPSSWSTKSDTMADKGGVLGIFFMAFTLALVSFSCTGPIIGTALVQSATNTLGPFIVMLGFSLALALPFGLFAAVPAMLNSLPQSGGWMNSVKVVLGFLELALAFKFLSVADLTNGWGFLRYEIFMAAWVLCFAGMTAYLFGLFKFPHDSPVKKLSPLRMILALLSLAFTIYLVTGFFYNDKTKSYSSLAAMSGLAPPSQYNYFLDKPKPAQSIKDQYPSYSICANNIPCFKDYYEGKAYAASVGKPVFLDFTGHGCVNCRKTEEHIWIKDEIRDKLVDDWVLVSLYVDEDTKLDNVYISKQRQKKLRNIGNKWTDFQIVNFEQNSQPLYVMMTAEEQVLASPRGYKEGVEGYAEYLECGYKAYENTK